MRIPLNPIEILGCAELVRQGVPAKQVARDYGFPLRTLNYWLKNLRHFDGDIHLLMSWVIEQPRYRIPRRLRKH